MQVVCDTVSMDFLKGAVVEYEDSLMRSAFQVGAVHCLTKVWVAGCMLQCYVEFSAPEIAC